MPRTLSLLSPSEIELRRERATDMLRNCNLCERRCGINRLEGHRAPCGLNHESHCFKRHISFAEEIDLLPSYMVYFGGCNFRCRFCVQAPDCFNPKGGTPLDPAAAAADFQNIISRGAKTINLLGGEPSLHLHTILAIAANATEPLPLLLNSNMYMTPEVIDLLDGVISTYIADFKFGNNACAASLAGIDRYTEVVGRNLLHAATNADLIVRHLLMPGHIDCCLRPVVSWMAAHLPDTPFTLMTGYVPGWKAQNDPQLSRLLTRIEVAEAEAIVARSKLRTSA